MLQQLVHHYHIALIGSTGSPKQRVKDHYISLRDLVIGSTVWARKTETIVVMQREHGKETDEITIATVLLRNNRPEQFPLVFDPSTGRLRILTDEERAARQIAEEDSAFLKWVLAHARFTRAQARRAFSKMSGETLQQRLEQLLQAKVILPDGKQGQSPRYVVPSIFEDEKVE